MFHITRHWRFGNKPKRIRREVYVDKKRMHTISIVITLLIIVSLIGYVWGYVENGFQYETIGGEISPINFITTFLVPALIIIGIFGTLIVLGIIRISKADANESA